MVNIVVVVLGVARPRLLARGSSLRSCMALLLRARLLRERLLSLGHQDALAHFVLVVENLLLVGLDGLLLGIKLAK